MVKNKKKTIKIISILGSMILLVLLACAVYLNDYYRADVEAIEDFTSAHEVGMIIDAQNNLIFEPESAEMGFIFYPGGKVEYTAYCPLMESLASEGILCVLVKMPFHMAVLDMSAADGIQEQYPQIENWFIGGHSLGGSMAASYLAKTTEVFEGLILLGSYSTADLTETDLQILSVYGSEDEVLNREKYESNKENVSSDFEELVIDGGCHAYFGMYGRQKGDGEPVITNVEQIDITTEAIKEFVFDN